MPSQIIFPSLNVHFTEGEAFNFNQTLPHALGSGSLSDKSIRASKCLVADNRIFFHLQNKQRIQNKTNSAAPPKLPPAKEKSETLWRFISSLKNKIKKKQRIYVFANTVISTIHAYLENLLISVDNKHNGHDSRVFVT